MGKSHGKNGKVPSNNTGRREPRTHIELATTALRRPFQTWRRKGTSAQGGRGLARGNLTRLPRPVSSWRATAFAWTGPSSRVASSVSHHLPPLGRLPPAWVVRSPVAFLVATPRWTPAAALPVWTFCGAQYLGKAATLVSSRWSFARRHKLGTLADWWGLQRHCGGICRPGLVRASAHLSGVLVGAGVTPAVHSHGPAPLAPVVSLIVGVRMVG